MQYHPDDFLALSVAVEHEGGALHREACLGKTVRLKQPDDGRMVWKRHQTTHCDMSARMSLPYNPRNPVNITEGDVTVVHHPGEDLPAAGSVTVCAVDDAVGLWPRYAGIVTNRSYQKA